MSTTKWTTREQLCLASAVSCSGDQNWMSVSRAVKLVCNPSGTRSPDWCSQKSCAVQYGHMLENVETPKRKKRSSESGVPSPAPVDTPTDLILRRLTDERILELKAELRREREEYTKIYHDLKAMQAGQLGEEQLWEMWREIEQQQETQRIEEMKLENQMREREQRKQELQRNWRPASMTPVTSVPQLSAKSVGDNIVAVDMDVEEIIGTTTKPMATQTSTNAPNSGTSPLLSSLLKSPNGGNGSITAPVPQATTAARATAAAPTITTLLTSGSIPNSNQPAITLKSSISSSEAAQLLSRPISGPPLDAIPSTSSGGQTLLSPSQSAPTLSMLLEKNKMPIGPVAGASGSTVPAVLTPQSSFDSNKTGSDASLPPPIKKDIPADSNNDEIPMDIEEGRAPTTTSTIQTATSASTAVSPGDSTNIDSDEPDPNEEQQLLEVFKHIGNIDDLDIDVANVINDDGVDFLKGVDDESTHVSPGMEKQVADPLATNTDQSEHILEQLSQSESRDSQIKQEPQDELGPEEKPIKKEDPDLDEESEDQEDGGKEPIYLEEVKSVKIEESKELPVSSSDDSNDNIPLSAVASGELEYRARAQNAEHIGSNSRDGFALKEKKESVAKNEDFKSLDRKPKDPASWCKTETKEELMPTDGTEELASLDDLKAETTPAAVAADVKDREEKKPDVSHRMTPTMAAAADQKPFADNKMAIKQPKEKLKREPTAEQIADDLSDSKEEDATESEENALREEKDVSTELMDGTEPNDGPLEGDPLAVDECAMVDDEIVADELPPPSLTHAMSTIDTDYDSSTTDASITTRKDEIRTGGRKKQRSLRHDEDSQSTPTHQATPVRPPMLRKLRDRDRSESPLIDNDSDPLAVSFGLTSGGANPRSRRRYSSSQVLDSIPNSPASASDRDDGEREQRSSKKSLLSIYNALQPQKYSSLFQRAMRPDDPYTMAKFEKTYLRPMDWPTIKRHIETGGIRSVHELQRDIMLMCNNALMAFKTDSDDYKAVRVFIRESQSMREFVLNANTARKSAVSESEKESMRDSLGGGNRSNMSTPVNNTTSGGGTKGRGARKSQRIS